MFSKKAQTDDMMWWLIDIIFLAVIILSASVFIDKLGSETSFQKKFLANDMALLIDTLYAVPGNVYVDYPQNTMWFNVGIKNGVVEVYDKEDKDLQGESAYFVEETERPVGEKSFSPIEGYTDKRSFIQRYLPIFSQKKITPPTRDQTLNITFVKTDKGIDIGQNQIPNINEEACKYVRTIEDVYFIRTDSNKDKMEFMTPTLEAFGKVVEIQDAEQGILFFIDINYSDDRNYTKVYYNADTDNKEEKFLSCRISNRFSEVFEREMDGYSYIPSNDVILSRKTGLSLTGKKVVYLKVGFTSKGENGLWRVQNAIAQAFSE